jgi:hypothetical protein
MIRAILLFALLLTGCSDPVGPDVDICDSGKTSPVVAVWYRAEDRTRNIRIRYTDEWGDTCRAATNGTSKDSLWRYSFVGLRGESYYLRAWTYPDTGSVTISVWVNGVRVAEKTGYGKDNFGEVVLSGSL